MPVFSCWYVFCAVVLCTTAQNWFWDRKITNLFRQTNVHFAYKSSKTIQQRTRPRTKDTTQDKDKSAIYNLTCKTCKKIVHRPNQQNSDHKTSWTHQIHKEQRPTIRIRITQITKLPWIWAHQWHHVITQTGQEYPHVNPLWTTAHTVFPP